MTYYILNQTTCDILAVSVANKRAAYALATVIGEYFRSRDGEAAAYWLENDKIEVVDAWHTRYATYNIISSIKAAAPRYYKHPLISDKVVEKLDPAIVAKMRRDLMMSMPI